MGVQLKNGAEALSKGEKNQNLYKEKLDTLKVSGAMALIVADQKLSFSNTEHKSAQHALEDDMIYYSSAEERGFRKNSFKDFLKVMKSFDDWSHSEGYYNILDAWDGIKSSAKSDAVSGPEKTARKLVKAFMDSITDSKEKLESVYKMRFGQELPSELLEKQGIDMKYLHVFANPELLKDFLEILYNRIDVGGGVPPLVGEFIHKNIYDRETKEMCKAALVRALIKPESFIEGTPYEANTAYQDIKSYASTEEEAVNQITSYQAVDAEENQITSHQAVEEESSYGITNMVSGWFRTSNPGNEKEQAVEPDQASQDTNKEEEQAVESQKAEDRIAANLKLSCFVALQKYCILNADQYRGKESKKGSLEDFKGSLSGMMNYCKQTFSFETHYDEKIKGFLAALNESVNYNTQSQKVVVDYIKVEVLEEELQNAFLQKESQYISTAGECAVGHEDCE